MTRRRSPVTAPRYTIIPGSLGTPMSADAVVSPACTGSKACPEVE